MQLTEHILTKNDCWRAGRMIVPKGIMIHSPGVAQSNVNVFLRSWDQPGTAACVHAFVHCTGAVQTLPWNWRGWHAGIPKNGGVSANNTHIGIEILEPDGHSYAGGVMADYDAAKNSSYFSEVYQNAVELAAILCSRYALNPLEPGVLICHSEGYRLGIASNHADVMHWFPKHGKSMDSFRADVERKMKGESEKMTQEEFNEMFRTALVSEEQRVRIREVSGWAAEVWDKFTAAGIFDGTAPAAPLTREQAALVLERLGLGENAEK